MSEKKSLIIERGEEIHQKATQNKGRGKELSEAMLKHLERLHEMNEIQDNEIDLDIYEDEIEAIKKPKKPDFEKGLVTFSPSSVSKTDRELFYKAKKYPKDEKVFLPFQRRWVRNGSAIHAAVQKDLLYAEEHLKDPAFTVDRMENGRPSWEHNLKDVKQVEHGGKRFQLFGMMDGILEYKDGSKIGFEFKTKSTTIGAIGDFLMKDAQDSHKLQAIAYSLLFGVDEFIFLYESLAKDGWMKGEDAKPDMRAFYFKPTEAQKQELLDKFARVVDYVERNEKPEAVQDGSVYLFSEYKTQLKKDGVFDWWAWDAEQKRIKAEKKRIADEKRRKKAKK